MQKQKKAEYKKKEICQSKVSMTELKTLYLKHYI